MNFPVLLVHSYTPYPRPLQTDQNTNAPRQSRHRQIDRTGSSVTTPLPIATISPDHHTRRIGIASQHTENRNGCLVFSFCAGMYEFILLG